MCVSYCILIFGLDRLSAHFLALAAALTPNSTHNHRTGTLPTQMGQMTALEELYAYNNQIGGEMSNDHPAASLIAQNMSFRVVVSSFILVFEMQP